MNGVTVVAAPQSASGSRSIKTFNRQESKNINEGSGSLAKTLLRFALFLGLAWAVIQLFGETDAHPFQTSFSGYNFVHNDSTRLISEATQNSFFSNAVVSVTSVAGATVKILSRMDSALIFPPIVAAEEQNFKSLYKNYATDEWEYLVEVSKEFSRNIQSYSDKQHFYWNKEVNKMAKDQGWSYFQKKAAKDSMKNVVDNSVKALDVGAKTIRAIDKGIHIHKYIENPLETAAEDVGNLLIKSVIKNPTVATYTSVGLGALLSSESTGLDEHERLGFKTVHEYEEWLAARKEDALSFKTTLEYLSETFPTIELDTQSTSFDTWLQDLGKVDFNAYSGRLAGMECDDFQCFGSSNGGFSQDWGSSDLGYLDFGASKQSYDGMECDGVQCFDSQKNGYPSEWDDF